MIILQYLDPPHSSSNSMPYDLDPILQMPLEFQQLPEASPSSKGWLNTRSSYTALNLCCFNSKGSD